MPRLRPDSKRLPDIPGGEGWLSNELQQQLVHFQSSGSSADGELVALRTFQWIPPYPPVPLSRVGCCVTKQLIPGISCVRLDGSVVIPVR